MKRVAKSSTASVGLILHSSLLSLTLGLAVTLSIVLASAWHEFSWARHVQGVAAFDRLIYETAAEARLTRAAVMGAHYTGQDSAARYKKIHADYDAMLERALAGMDPTVIPAINDRIAAVRRSWIDTQGPWHEIEALHPDVAKETRDETVARWFVAATAVVNRLVDLSELETGEIRMTDPVIAELVTARQLSWLMRDVSGNECLLMRPYVVGAQRLTPEVQTKVAALREDGRTAMRIVDDLLTRPGAPPPLLRAVAVAKHASDAANGERDAAYRRLVGNGGRGTDAALSSEEWNAICVDKLFPVLMYIGTTALNLIGQHAAASEHEAAERLFLVIAGLLSVVTVSALALWQVRKRIMRPVKTLTDAIEHLTRRDYSKPVPQFPHRDEFSRMATTLESLRLGALEVEKAATERQHSQKLEALGTLAGGIAHDLNNTLVPVLTLAKLTARHLPEGGRERTNLETIHTAGMRARDLVKQILAFARREQVEKQPVDLAALTREALRLLRASIPATIRIVEDIDDVPPVLGDPGQLHQVIVNIATNGAQAIDGRIGQLTVSLKESRRRDTVTNQKLVSLSIQDTGIGMDAHTMGRIFDPFFTTKPVGEGTGLGLSVVHGIVTDHSGLIEVESHPGEGTQFQIYLPTLRSAMSVATEALTRPLKVV